MKPAVIDFTDYPAAICEALDTIGAGNIFSEQTAILLKPNLVTASHHPVTTSPEACAAVIAYIRKVSEAEIVIAEGTGDAHTDTPAVFSALGYDELAKNYQVELIDLNEAPLVKREDPACSFFPEIYLPRIAFSHFIVSLPVLKAHSLSTLTGTLKNMIGFAPPRYYAGRFGIWKKAVFHRHIHRAIRELNRYRTPDLSLLDASIGLRDYHLGGACCDPPANKIVAGTDPLAVDRTAATLLGINWEAVPHLQ